MKFADLLDIVGDQPVFSSSLLRVGDIDPVDVASQLSRWVTAGKLVRLRRGVYVVAVPFRRRDPHAFEVANALVHPSYVSMESALSFHGLIPEAVFVTTSVTTARAGAFDTPIGRFAYRHIGPQLMFGYAQERLGSAPGAVGLIARPEKALLDLVYLRPGGDAEPFLRELRLDRLDRLDADTLLAYAARTGKPKLIRAAQRLARMFAESEGEWVAL